MNEDNKREDAEIKDITLIEFDTLPDDWDDQKRNAVIATSAWVVYILVAIIGAVIKFGWVEALFVMYSGICGCFIYKYANRVKTQHLVERIIEDEESQNDNEDEDE